MSTQNYRPMGGDEYRELVDRFRHDPVVVEGIRREHRRRGGKPVVRDDFRDLIHDILHELGGEA